jgi:Sulfotransferase domain
MALATGDILLTGPARSGTTLTCACLNQLPDCLALAEPMTPPTQGNIDDALQHVSRFLTTARTKALTEKKATTKMAEAGFDTANWFDPPDPSRKIRASREFVGELTVNKALSPHFKLIVKHPGFFTALARPLQDLYPLYAIVRDPLATLASWQTVDMPVNRGRWPVAEVFSPALRERLLGLETPLDRQVALLRWCYETYERLPRNRVLRYEDLTANPPAALKDFHSGIETIDVSIHAADPATRYAGVDLAHLARKLRPYAADFEWIYPELGYALDALAPGHR